MDRRTFLTTSGLAVAGAAFSPSIVFAESGDVALNALFERIFQERVATSPELATSLGLDKGPLAALKGQLSPATAAERQRDLQRTQVALAALAKVDRASLSPAAQLNLDVVRYSLETQTVAPGKFQIDSVQRPYPIFQQGGAYFSIPDFLNTAHTIRTSQDCEAYLSRLDAFARVLDEDSEEQRVQAARGFLAPGWSLDLTLGQMGKLRGQPAESSTMVQSLVDRAKAAGIAGDWQARAAAIVSGKVYPALDRQIALIKQLRPTTKPGDGAWRLPDGEAIYAAALQQATTTTMSPEEVHQLGLAQVAEISAELDTILKGAGYTQGSVGARLAKLNVAPDQVYPNTDEGRAALIASLNERVKDMYTRLPRAFATLPTQPLEIRRVPPEIQDGASNGYYNRAALDGSRPAIYFINLKDTGDWPKYSLPSLTYHEGVPGHHLQISIAQESKDIPTLRKLGFFSAYSEGWALYAEQLANELDAYRSPLERAGYLQSFLFRAARLVVDTGIHTKRWSREQATDYMVATTGFARPRSQREVERYCTQMGQACSYKVGHMAWTRAREEAQKTLGDKFDIKRFHEVLKEGAMPLTILEQRIRERTKAVA
ncbi:hypothetical protein SCH01S_39_00240 [Sphingomonas changbaiensis NBRC 104936]|uniref:Tat pathway signal protein n=1 Tax=Sphingomonas changbaiensis NBRC 104936 TaxID=1219043 RepID=A0A0E9MQB0_9SPHN|nr:DUF885 family protein [Sphingomonas changbaiensis]GAO39739.1 hypothetical protein SCH01S_39_00240 [Sphingomonas changbaiensis NBRC 104936]